MLRFVTEGETPAKKNSRIVLKDGRNIPSRNYQNWHYGAKQSVMLQAQRYLKECSMALPIKDTVCIRLEFYHGDRRRRDSDNGTSSILDLLVDCGILEDDRWEIVSEINVRNYYEKNAARCVIEIGHI